MTLSLCEKCPYLEFFWSVFPRIWTEYGPEKLRTRTLFAQCTLVKVILHGGESLHCVKSVQIRSFFWSVFSRIQSKYGKIRTRKNPYLDTFHAVLGLMTNGYDILLCYIIVLLYYIMLYLLCYFILLYFMLFLTLLIFLFYFSSFSQVHTF